MVMDADFLPLSLEVEPLMTVSRIDRAVHGRLFLVTAIGRID